MLKLILTCVVKLIIECKNLFATPLSWISHRISYTKLKVIASIQAAYLDPTSRDLLSTQFRLAGALDKLGRFKESVALYEDVLDKSRSILGDDDSLTLTIQQNMAIVLNKSGASRRALRHFKDVLDKKKRILGPEDVETLRTQALMGPVLFRQEGHAEALKLLNQVLAKQKSILGYTHPDTQDSLFHINAIKAEVMLRKSAEIRSRCRKNGDSTELVVLIRADDSSVEDDLLESEIDVSSVSALKDSTTFHVAVNENNLDTIESLLKYARRHLKPRELQDFIDSRTKSAAGNTAMHIAAIIGSLEAIIVLLRYGATYNRKNRNGKTPRELAKVPRVVSFLGAIEEAARHQAH